MIAKTNSFIYKFISRGLLVIFLSSIFTLDGLAGEKKFRDLSKIEIAELYADLNPERRKKRLIKFYQTADDYNKYILLTKLSKTEIELEKYIQAFDYANELLNLSQKYVGDWNYGNAVHDANMVLGIVALQKNFTDKAKESLIVAGHAPPSPQLATFGPNMTLAKALLEKGEKQVVIDYFELLKSTWINNDGRLDSWIASIRGGGTPYFGMNLFL